MKKPTYTRVIWHNLKGETTTTQRHIRQQHDPLFPPAVFCTVLFISYWHRTQQLGYFFFHLSPFRMCLHVCTPPHSHALALMSIWRLSALAYRQHTRICAHDFFFFSKLSQCNPIFVARCSFLGVFLHAVKSSQNYNETVMTQIQGWAPECKLFAQT